MVKYVVGLPKRDLPYPERVKKCNAQRPTGFQEIIHEQILNHLLIHPGTCTTQERVRTRVPGTQVGNRY